MPTSRPIAAVRSPSSGRPASPRQPVRLRKLRRQRAGAFLSAGISHGQAWRARLAAVSFAATVALFVLLVPVMACSPPRSHSANSLSAGEPPGAARHGLASSPLTGPATEAQSTLLPAFR